MRITTPTSHILLIVAGGIAAAISVLAIFSAASADGAMKSRVIAPGLCETTGGGRFVKIPGSPGEKIDRRLLADVAWLKRRYNVFITDGYSLDPVHSANGEHPVGLALDIIPNFADGGSWRDINRLARWAEPTQNAPRAPFRWVGYNGDANHGKGHHLHLSWDHSTSKYDKPARVVYSARCPQGGDGTTAPNQPPSPPPAPDNGGGGTTPDTDPDDTGGGGVSPRPRRVELSTVEDKLQASQATAVTETSGVGVP